MLPSVIRAVGAGTASVNADYLYAGTIDVGKIVPLWSQSGTLDVGPSVFYLATRFILFGAIPDGYTYPSRLYSLPLSDITAEPPPKGGWEVSTPGYPDVAILGLAPAPYLDGAAAKGWMGSFNPGVSGRCNFRAGPGTISRLLDRLFAF